MADTEKAKFSILANRDVRLPVSRVDQALSAVLDVTLAEARMRARDARGILFEGLSLEQARSIQSVLEHEDIGTFILPMEDVLDLIPLREIRQMRPDDEKIQVKLGVGEDDLVSLCWDRVGMVSAGAVGTQSFWSKTQEKLVKRLPDLRNLETSGSRDRLMGALANQGLRSGGDPSGEDSLDEYVALLRSEARWLVDLYCLDVPFRYRFDLRRALFPNLEQEECGSSRSLERFLHVLTDLLLSADEVVVPPVTVSLPGDPFDFELVFDDMNGFERYSRWFFTMVEQEKCSSATFIDSFDGREQG